MSASDGVREAEAALARAEATEEPLGEKHVAWTDLVWFRGFGPVPLGELQTQIRGVASRHSGCERESIRPARWL